MSKEAPDRGELLEIIANKDAEIMILRSQVLERDAIIHNITNSIAWKLTLPYRLIFGVLKGLVSAFLLLITNPRKFVVSSIQSMARYVRGRPKLRAYAHKWFAKLPEPWQRRLISLAPPAQAEMGMVFMSGYSGRKDLLGDALWVCTRLIG